MTKPTYSAYEIRKMCSKFDYENFETLAGLIDEEIGLYSHEDLIILTQASVILLTRSILKLSLKYIK